MGDGGECWGWDGLGFKLGLDGVAEESVWAKRDGPGWGSFVNTSMFSNGDKEGTRMKRKGCVWEAK